MSPHEEPPIVARRLRSIQGLPAILFVGAAAFGGWSLLLPVVPLALSLEGESDAVAGASTAVFMGSTVATQFATPKALRAWGYRFVLAAGCTLLGAPALGFLLSVEAIPVLAVSAVRGIGFGVCQNDSLVLVFAEAGPHRRGSARAAWNAAYDGGTGVGALSLGVVATVSGYSIAFLLAAGAVLLVLPIRLTV